MYEIEKKSKIFFAVVGLLIAGSVAATYWRLVIKRNYIIVAQADCDPYAENCFVHICDPDPNADGECTGDPAEDIWYTKNISRMAYNIPDCDPSDENCTALVCGENEADCSYELCDENNVPDGDTCNDSEQYKIDNPVEEETIENEDAAVCDSELDGVCSEDNANGLDSEEGDAATTDATE